MANTLQNAIVRTAGDTIGTSGATRIAVDAVKVWTAIKRHLPGEWLVMKQGELEHYEGKHTRWIRVERKADGLRLTIDSSTNYGREPAIRVSMGSYSYPSGSQLDERWCRERAGVKDKVTARMSIDNATPERIAKAIVRRVIKPAELVLPHILKCIADDQARLNKRAAAIAALRKAGQRVWEREPMRPGSEARVEWGSNSADIQSDGGLRLSHVYIAPSDAVRFAEFMRTVKRDDREDV